MSKALFTEGGTKTILLNGIGGESKAVTLTLQPQGSTPMGNPGEVRIRAEYGSPDAIPIPSPVIDFSKPDSIKDAMQAHSDVATLLFLSLPALGDIVESDADTKKIEQLEQQLVDAKKEAAAAAAAAEAAAQTEKDKAEATLAKAEAKAETAEKVLATAKTELDATKNELTDTKTALVEVETAVESAKADVTKKDKQIASLEAKLKEAKAAAEAKVEEAKAEEAKAAAQAEAEAEAKAAEEAAAQAAEEAAAQVAEEAKAADPANLDQLKNTERVMEQKQDEDLREQNAEDEARAANTAALAKVDELKTFKPTSSDPNEASKEIKKAFDIAKEAIETAREKFKKTKLYSEKSDAIDNILDKQTTDLDGAYEGLQKELAQRKEGIGELSASPTAETGGTGGGADGLIKLTMKLLEENRGGEVTPSMKTKSLKRILGRSGAVSDEDFLSVLNADFSTLETNLKDTDKFKKGELNNLKTVLKSQNPTAESILDKIKELRGFKAEETNSGDETYEEPPNTGGESKQAESNEAQAATKITWKDGQLFQKAPANETKIRRKKDRKEGTLYNSGGGNYYIVPEGEDREKLGKGWETNVRDLIEIVDTE